MAIRELPENGAVRLGAVTLPPGRRVIPDDHGAVAWVTSSAVPNPGQVWSALHDLHPQTGLVPVLLDDDPEADTEDFFFCGRDDPREIDDLDAAAVLAERWEDPDYEEPLSTRFAAPRSNEFLA